MLCLSGFELYSRWVPLYIVLTDKLKTYFYKLRVFRIDLSLINVLFQLFLECTQG